MEVAGGDDGERVRSDDLVASLSSSSTKVRRNGLQLLQRKVQDAGQTSESISITVIDLLFKTYPYYTDRASRRAVEDCLRADGLYPPHTSGLLDRYQTEAAKPTLATSNAFVLVEWGSVLLQHIAAQGQDAFAIHGIKVVQAHARVLELVISSPYKSRETVRKAALVVTRRALRKIVRLLGKDAVSMMVKKLASKDQTVGARNATFLGVIAGVCAHLPMAKAILGGLEDEYYAFYTREILGSRTPVPPHLALALNDFFSNYTSQDRFSHEIIIPMERALLRAPEVVLNDLISPLLVALPDDVDLVFDLANHISKPLLSNLKSSNTSVRDGAIKAFSAFIRRSRDQATLAKVVEDIIAPMESPKLSADHRALHAKLLALFPVIPASSSQLCVRLCQILAKEPNEGATTYEISALLRQIEGVSTNEEAIIKTTVTACTKGLCDKRPGVRRQWLLGVGQILRESNRGSEFQHLVAFEADCLPYIIQIMDEVIQNPMAAVASGLAVGALVTASLCHRPSEAESGLRRTLIDKAKVIDKALSGDMKTSTLLNQRVYTKLSEDDLVWQIRALCASFKGLAGHTEIALLWAQSFIYLAAVHQSPRIRENASTALKDLYIEHQTEVSTIIIEGLWAFILNIEDKEGNKGSPSPEKARLVNVIRSIFPISASKHPGAQPSRSTSMQDQLIRVLVLCRPEILPQSQWIELCLRVNEDPGQIARDRPLECLEKVEHCLVSWKGIEVCPLILQAAYNTVAELAFVAPDTIIPILLTKIRDALSAEEVARCEPTEAAIARTPEGIAFVDVLNTQNQKYAIDKNSRDYETMAWEQEMRAQLASKKGHEKKLTADERKKVEAQLSKESDIRKTVRRLEQRLQTGVGYIHALAVGPPTEATMWLSLSLQALTEVIAAGAAKIIGGAADEAYLACSNFVSNRLGHLRRFIGIATLRALGSRLPSQFEQESLKDLVMRILYRLHFMSEQRAFDDASLLYILPLIAAIIRQDGISCTSTDEKDEQMTLSLEILSHHADRFANINLPRAEFLSLVVEAMPKCPQHFKLLKDLFADLCRAIGPTISHTQELPIILEAVITSQPTTRTSILQAVRDHVDLTDFDFCEQIWLAKFDDDAENAKLGDLIWSENVLESEASDATKLLPYLAFSDRSLRMAAARGLAACIGESHDTFVDVLEQLETQYSELIKPRRPEVDVYGMPKKTDLSDPWEARDGIALAFLCLGPVFVKTKLVLFIEFLIRSNALGDRNTTVRNDMITGATLLIALHGASHVEQLMHIFKTALDQSARSPSTSDAIGEAVVILYGALARHLPHDDSRVPQVVNRLLLALETPSETVQFAVANCLPPLVEASSDMTSGYVKTVMEQMLTSKKFAVRRGAAYGLAGIVKGKGISALREYRILSNCKAATENKKDQNQRQAALFAYELLALILGPIFEPYIIQIVPQLLSSFGDATADVRDACLDASKSCFAHLSSYGVKLILPTLLEGLEESQWRSKKGACDLLGAMAYLDPQQLAVSLPDIIPPLTNVLNDSHKEVRAAANRSLQRFGEVISNPEIKSLVGILLKALSDPTKHTDDALEALIKVSFVHYLDSPSLALIVRILQRGLSDRSATKRKSAQIIGSLAHLTERRDVISHLPILVAGLKTAIVDPVPSTRATASKALGSLVEKLGEDALPDLIPSLMSTLRSDTGAGDRLGSAQALSEVLAGLGTGRLEETLPTILQNVASMKATVREGFMSLFIYLPACFGNSFANYLSSIIPSILSGLADDVESIRETSLKAGRLLVKNFATKAIDLLLPELDRGLANDSYRIRLSSVELVGDLLFNLTGITGNTEEDEVGESGATEAGQSLLEVLGLEKRNKILSSLYICRYDTSGLVRSAAINVWKALVATPRTLKELVPTLIQLLIERLASSNAEQKLIAGNALAEFIRKAGEGVLETLLPSLEEGLRTSTDRDNRQGICIALREILSSASQETLEDHAVKLVAVVKIALVDSDNEVREAAAGAFDSLQKLLGRKAVDQIMPDLLKLLRTEGEAETALSALLTLLSDNARSNAILPNLVDELLKPPISAFNARAIASLAQVAGSAMIRRLTRVLNDLTDNIIQCKEDTLRNDLEDAFDTILLSVDEFDGLNNVMSIMLALVKHNDHRKRAVACIRLGNFFANADVDYSRYHQDLIRVLLISFDDSDEDVIKAAWLALTELTKHLKKEEMESLVLSTRQVLQQVGVPGVDLKGFELPKGITAILPIFLQGLMNGSADQRTNAALAISDIIDRSSANALKASVTQITGPLIRVVSERSVDVRAAILLTLNNLLEKIPTFLKPFLPQLQRTFAKSLADTSSEILRKRAAKALGTLITLTPRIDPLIAELVTGSKTPDQGVQHAMLQALYEVVSKAGSNMSEASRSLILALIDSDTSGTDDKMAITFAKLMGALAKSLPPGFDASSLIKMRVLTTHMSNASALNLNAVLLDSPATLTKPYAQQTPALICHGISHKNTFISDNCVLAAGKYLLTVDDSPLKADASVSLLEALANSIQPGGPVDTRRLSLVVIRTLCRTNEDLVNKHLDILVPPIFASVRDIVLPVKLAAETAFLAVFAVVQKESEVFDLYLADTGSTLDPATKRRMQEYFKRVALKLGIQARERKEAEGGQGGLGLSNDERDDEREIWSVGRVDLGEGTFSKD